ncbi:hypothetical protein NKR23_g1033 [Pleurostoma richardsiae]|uniref:Uncharacterized protein n=1 Tax=Pleurostoma richardsiae TaxID=41990 RepID=A0AA38RSU1_9PEZI|nr:hypothetical protein NKR23_g1033 [Pleurostoma richardsiae]
MTSLPAQHPTLAIHLTDRALTPIISSAASSSSSDQPHTSSTTTDKPRRLAALSSLSATALAAHDAAKRFNMGSPLRMMVEYAPGGPLLLESFLCPMSLVMGADPTNSVNANADRPGSPASDAATAAGSRPGTPRPVHHEQPAAGGVPDEEEEERRPAVGVAVETNGVPGLATLVPQRGGGYLDDEDDNDEDDDPNGPPMLIGLVLAPHSADGEAVEARRAARRLERLARTFQTEWIAEQRAERAGGAADGSE